MQLRDLRPPSLAGAGVAIAGADVHRTVLKPCRAALGDWSASWGAATPAAAARTARAPQPPQHGSDWQPGAPRTPSNSSRPRLSPGRGRGRGGGVRMGGPRPPTGPPRPQPPFRMVLEQHGQQPASICTDATQTGTELCWAAAAQHPAKHWNLGQGALQVGQAPSETRTCLPPCLALQACPSRGWAPRLAHLLLCAT
jgi:hypothetical protein